VAIGADLRFGQVTAVLEVYYAVGVMANIRIKTFVSGLVMTIETPSSQTKGLIDEMIEMPLLSWLIDGAVGKVSGGIE